MNSVSHKQWKMRGTGYEFCNCDFGCGCNFGGFPNSSDGSCRAIVGLDIKSGSCGEVDLSGVRCAAIVDWPKAIHEGNGRCVFVVEPSASEEQIGVLSEICTGQLGGLPWELLGPTFEVVGLEKVAISIEGDGLNRSFRAEGLLDARGSSFRNPVTGEEHQANIELPAGFIWTRGQCGVGSFNARAGSLELGFENTNWILYEFDWGNEVASAA